MVHVCTLQNQFQYVLLARWLRLNRLNVKRKVLSIKDKANQDY